MISSHLYFICPTDYLETVINNKLQQENYFVTSIGNSLSFNQDLVEEIISLIEVKQVSEVTFVLSNTNKIILGTLIDQEIYRIERLKNYYNAITTQLKRSMKVWQTPNIRIPIIANYLHLKIRELQSRLQNQFSNTVKINAMIYNREKGVFNEVHTSLFSLKLFDLN